MLEIIEKSSGVFMINSLSSISLAPLLFEVNTTFSKCIASRITFENIHVTLGVFIFYIVLARLIYKVFNPTPSLGGSIFPGQRLIAKLNHFFLYISILIITISGSLKKLFNGEKLDFFFIDLKIKDNFDLADFFYDIHIIGNYILIFLVLLHIIAVFIHRFLFKENLLKKIL